jgi:hypothetical protein
MWTGGFAGSSADCGGTHKLGFTIMWSSRQKRGATNMPQPKKEPILG